MSALAYVQHVAIFNHGAHIAVLFGGFGKTKQAVEPRHHVGIDLYLGDKLLRSRNQFVEKAFFQRLNFLVGTQYSLLIFLQFLRDVAFGLGQSLLAHPLFGHLILIRVAHFEVVTKHVVVANFKAADACCLGFALLNVDEEIASATRYVAQFVQFSTKSLGNNVAAIHHQWRVGLYFVFNSVAQTFAKVHLFAYPAYRFVLRFKASNLQWLYG